MKLHDPMRDAAPSRRIKADMSITVVHGYRRADAPPIGSIRTQSYRPTGTDGLFTLATGSSGGAFGSGLHPRTSKVKFYCVVKNALVWPAAMLL